MPISNSLTEGQILSEIRQRKDVALEYLRLAVLPVLTDEQEERMQEIFQQAEADPLLGFLIDEADHIAGHELELIDSGYIAEQQEKLAETLDRTWVQSIIEKSRLKKYAQLPQKTVETAQIRLKRHGLYSGKIDGIWGEQTKAAFYRLEKELRDDLGMTGVLPTLNDDKSISTTSRVIELVKAQGREYTVDFQEKADLLSLKTWLPQQF